MVMLKYGLAMFNWFKKSKQNSSVAGQIILSYDREGNIDIDMNIPDISVESAKILSMLLFQIQYNYISPHIYDALTAWAGNNKQKNAFNQVMAEFLIALDELGVEAGEKLAVEPTQVFDIKGLQGK